MNVRSFVRPACDGSSAVIKQMVTRIFLLFRAAYLHTLSYSLLCILQNGEYPKQ